MFNQRSHRKELLDEENIPAGDLYRNVRELDLINHWLGGYRISFAALKKVLDKTQTCILADIGCGGGDTLKRIYDWKQKSGYQLQLHGIDIKPVCIDYARKNIAVREISLICDDYRSLYLHLPKIDIIHASLFCHHLSDTQLAELVRFALDHRATLVINDLERNPLAYYSIQWLTRLFSKSYLVKNDAPLSVLRGFKKREWKELLHAAGAKNFTVKNKWAFRHEVIVYGKEL
ncbi:methyltransferase domain-containing protein [Dyadobacter sandarakinus]|uniref:Methyltransferase domain-containing protein n=1 Tax=Dyadobacter sandarakinus TaxID=2747268 RepID=A0ABX7I652_9BACT|nr:methyltransferase domain-containing protein [Dyadobacter sandarakinus]QRR00972.1 methyltransferase domain-containing protein [Dyadobacter sandarakinus]